MITSSGFAHVISRIPSFPQARHIEDTPQRHIEDGFTTDRRRYHDTSRTLHDIARMVSRLSEDRNTCEALSILTQQPVKGFKRGFKRMIGNKRKARFSKIAEKPIKSISGNAGLVSDVILSSLFYEYT